VKKRFGKIAISKADILKAGPMKKPGGIRFAFHRLKDFMDLGL
jgi:hypothetical protein